MNFDFTQRLKILKICLALVFLTFTGKIAQLQIFEHEDYLAQAKAQHEKRSVLPARRGKILVRKNKSTKEVTPLATNNTLKMLFIDPFILNYPKYNPELAFNEQEKGNPALAAELLAPLLIHAHCEEVEGCDIETDIDKMTPAEQTAIRAYQENLLEKFSKTERTRVLLETEVSESRILEIESFKLSGIFIEGQSIIANPTLISDVKMTAKKLANLLNLEQKDLERLITRRPKRYEKITAKIVPEVAQKIIELKQNKAYYHILRGVVMKDEHWRYYPEKKLAAQVLGFTDFKGIGQYGIEGYLNHILKGESGYINGATNTRGQRILGANSNITQAKDGADILISIDRIIQNAIEKILDEDLKEFDADSAQVLVMDPKTGKILAMAHAPSFDPNDFGNAYLRYEIEPEKEYADRDDETFNQRIPTVVEDSRFYRYFNTWGPAVFRNKSVNDLYEPGSVMKALTMAAAINSGEVSPDTIFNDSGPVLVDQFKIRNSDKVYAGPTSMISVINRSLNTGIAFITRKMGRKLWYDYLKNFGFGEYTDIQLDGELKGTLKFWQDWAPSELITSGYGQGISVTLIQMSLAFSTIANGGYLMKPILVEEIHYPDGTKKIFPPTQIRRVISDETYNKIKSMLLKSVDNGVANLAQVKGYRVMGKTGTSQTYKFGEAQEGLGTTITSFGGFGPFIDPKFVILVKYDYPKQSQWGSETAAVTFQKIAKFLFDYYEIPPDR